MMTINNVGGAANSVQPVRANMNGQMDSVSRSIQDQIVNAQKQLQELGANRDMTPEEKMKRRQEIQQEIANLNQQLRQHQIEKRREQQAESTAADKSSNSQKETDASRQNAGFSTTGMQAVLSADASIKQAKVQGSVAAQMEGRAGVLKMEIKLDGARGGDTSAKQAELAEVEQKAEQAANSQLNTLAEANQTMAEAANTEQTDKKAGSGTETADKADSTDKAQEEVQENEKISSGDDNEMEALGEQAATSGKDLRPADRKHIDIRL